jgi:hypothetical protein
MLAISPAAFGFNVFLDPLPPGQGAIGRTSCRSPLATWTYCTMRRPGRSAPADTSSTMPATLGSPDPDPDDGAFAGVRAACVPAYLVPESEVSCGFLDFGHNHRPVPYLRGAWSRRRKGV